MAIPHNSAVMSVTCSAPGSIMISGEHAVLHGYHALVGAIDRRVTVNLTVRSDKLISIKSALGNRRMRLDSIDAAPPFRFIGAVLKKYAPDMRHGVDLSIEAQFAHDVGLGSSAAVTAATLTAVKTMLTGNAPEYDELLREGLGIIRDVQGRGSGSDIAASIYGGVVLYRRDEVIRRHTDLPHISLVYAGYKTPTPEVIRIVEEHRSQSEDGFKSLFERFENFTMAADNALARQDWRALGNALSRGQLMLEMLGVCDDSLAEILAAMAAMPEITGAKISGSGLGDCVIGIGEMNKDMLPSEYRHIPVNLSDQGLTVNLSQAV